MILKNRVNTVSTDFVYTLANGDNKNMQNSDYLILSSAIQTVLHIATLTHEWLILTR